MRYLPWMFLSIFLCATVSPAVGQQPQANNSPQLAQSRELTSQVVQLYREHKFDEALPLAKRALELDEAALGKTDPRLMGPLINLGFLYAAKHDHTDQAKAAFFRALSLGEAAYGPEDLRLTRPLDELGYLYRNKGDYDKSTEMFARSMKIKEKSLPPGHVEIARAAFSLGDAYRRGREDAKAEALYRQAVQLYEKSEPKKFDELAEVLRRYSIVLADEKKTDEAAAVRQRLSELSGAAGIEEADIVNGRAIKLREPEYPAIARSAYASGQVRVQVLIDETGKVISAEAISGHPLLHGAAVAAAKDSKFTPTFKGGRPIKVIGFIIYNFVYR